jgi:hypothetical protein
MSSRATAFSKRSQSFVDRGVVSHHSAGTMAPASISPPLSDWGAPGGKLDWGIHGEELNKLRKSASFAIRGNGTNVTGVVGSGVSAAQDMSMVSEEPDVSWVHSMVKDGPPVGAGYGVEQKLKQQKFHLNSGAGEFQPGDMLPSWADQLYVEQEQMVA